MKTKEEVFTVETKSRRKSRSSGEHNVTSKPNKSDDLKQKSDATKSTLKNKNSMDIKYSCYPEKIKKMILEDPFRPLHNWGMFKHLDKLKDATGIEAKKGYLSSSEVKQVEENIALYTSMNPNINFFKLVYEQRNKEKTKIFKETCFWDIISYNLCRRLEIIHFFILRKYRKEAGYKIGRFSKQENIYLNQLVHKYGRNWTLISNLMNRTADTVSTYYSHFVKNKINEGPWTEEEKEKFIGIMKRLLQCNQNDGLPLYKINLRIVSDFILTRSVYECKSFVKANKKMLENLLLNNQFTMLLKEPMIIYIYFSKDESSVDELKWEELFILFNGKLTENELKKEYHNITTILPNCEKIKTEYKSLFEIAENLFSRIKFEHVLITMSKPRTTAYLKAKYYLLVNENLQKRFRNNTAAEEIIMILHDKYVSKLMQKHISQSQTTDLVEQSITRNMMKPSIDLTLISDDDDLSH